MRRTSATGTEGFTLLEILVVVTIIGIVVALAAVNLVPGDRELARREAARLALALEHARDAAWFGGRPTAISFGNGQARLWRYSGSTWQPDATRDLVIPEHVRIASVTRDNVALPATDKLVFLPDGLDEPFRVALDVRGLAWSVEGDIAGAVTVVEK